MNDKYKNETYVQYITDLIFGRRVFFEPVGCYSFKELSDQMFYFGNSHQRYNSQIDMLDRTPQCYFDNLTMERKNYFRYFKVLSDKKYKKVHKQYIGDILQIVNGIVILKPVR